MKGKIILGLVVIMLLMLTVGCEYTPSQQETVTKSETKAVSDNMDEMNRQIGMPLIDEFFEKKTAKMIFELRDNSKLVTYAYTQNLEGQYVYLGKAIGFGLPYSVQYTNPEKLVDVEDFGIQSYQSNDAANLPQADPNGLYMPEGLSATWLMLINEETGEPEIIYTEPSIVVTQSKLPRRLVASWSLPEDY